jgi:hypothetical protein
MSCASLDGYSSTRSVEEGVHLGVNRPAELRDLLESRAQQLLRELSGQVGFDGCPQLGVDAVLLESVRKGRPHGVAHLGCQGGLVESVGLDAVDRELAVVRPEISFSERATACDGHFVRPQRDDGTIRPRDRRTDLSARLG